MKTLYTLIITAMLMGCGPAYNQYHSLNKAFTQGCNLHSIESSLNSTEDTLEFTATCTKAK